MMTVIMMIGILLLTLITKERKDNDILSSKNDMIAVYIEDESGEYSLSNTNVFPKEGYELNLEKSTCQNGGILSQDANTKLISLKTATQDKCTVYFKKETPTSKVLRNFNITSNGEKTNFDDPATTNEGVFEMTEDYGVSYYYRGAVENNYVKFGKNSSGKWMWWRIIRINGDGSVRMIYDGAQSNTDNENTYTRGFTHTNQKFNSLSDDAKYVGYMYGPANEVEGVTTPSGSKTQAQTNTVDSDIKKVIDEWYEDNILDTGYAEYLSDEIFCNDRSIPGQSITEHSLDTGLGYGTNVTGYEALGRFATGNNSTGSYAKTEIQPKFTCEVKNDAFTVKETEKGNGSLTYPIGLITADEIVAAGSGKYNTGNTSYYLYKNTTWNTITLSPFYYYSNACVFRFTSGGYLNYNGVASNGWAVAPVINLGAETSSSMVGTGIISDPYRVG